MHKNNTVILHNICLKFVRKLCILVTHQVEGGIQKFVGAIGVGEILWGFSTKFEWSTIDRLIAVCFISL